ncbi:DEAD/DEAH box helicase [Candidatus Woesearchaeota archaeon]|nr:DEAD/DEAH box helicase [Candidatus Woesearchaeota archaeon]
MKLEKLKDKIPIELYEILVAENISELRQAQVKAIKAGLLENKNLLICTPTASGKTLIAEMAFVKSILNREGKCVYIVPLKALASEKYNEFRRKYDNKEANRELFRVALSIGDFDKTDSYLERYDLLLVTPEKIDSLIRHHAPWLKEVRTVIIDEIHLLNDADRGPTLEIIITMMKMMLKKIHIIGLSATIGNPKELAEWLNAELVEDDWRPVKLEKGIYHDGKVEMYE